jgi:ABC-type thiamine transport system ATPase subunit
MVTLSAYSLLLFSHFFQENRFLHIFIQFNAGLGARPKQAKTIANQRRIHCLGERY